MIGDAWSSISIDHRAVSQKIHGLCLIGMDGEQIVGAFYLLFDVGHFYFVFDNEPFSMELSFEQGAQEVYLGTAEDCKYL